MTLTEYVATIDVDNETGRFLLSIYDRRSRLQRTVAFYSRKNLEEYLVDHEDEITVINEEAL